MLKKCLHGKTQNADESFNGMIWNRVPKAIHVGLDYLLVSMTPLPTLTLVKMLT